MKIASYGRTAMALLWPAETNPEPPNVLSERHLKVRRRNNIVRMEEPIQLRVAAGRAGNGSPTGSPAGEGDGALWVRVESCCTACTLWFDDRVPGIAYGLRASSQGVAHLAPGLWGFGLLGSSSSSGYRTAPRGYTFVYSHESVPGAFLVLHVFSEQPALCLVEKVKHDFLPTSGSLSLESECIIQNSHTAPTSLFSCS